LYMMGYRYYTRQKVAKVIPVSRKPSQATTDIESQTVQFEKKDS
jgi:hypothetical protein